jgi:hypothetical protein
VTILIAVDILWPETTQAGKIRNKPRNIHPGDAFRKITAWGYVNDPSNQSRCQAHCQQRCGWQQLSLARQLQPNFGPLPFVLSWPQP